MPILGTIASQVPANLPTNSFESIATATPSGTSVTFSNIPQTYKHLQVRVLARTTRNDATVDTVYYRFNEDTGNNYNVHTLSSNGSATSAAYYGAPTVLWGAFSTPTVLAGANLFSASIVDILDYTSTTKYKTTRVLAGSDRNGAGSIDFFTGLWRNTAAVTSIRFFAEGNYVSGSHLALYGIKG